MAFQPVILLVDPHSASRQFHKSLLHAAGYGVEEALNGVEGLERLHRLTSPVVVSCVEMPKMDGLNLVQQIRRHATFHALPVVLMDLGEDDETRRKALQAGANLYLPIRAGAEELTPLMDLLTGRGCP